MKGTNIEADWIDALIVGLDFLKTESADRKLAALKIVLFSELGCRFNMILNFRFYWHSELSFRSFAFRVDGVKLLF